MQEFCAIPYRRTHLGVEFCLVSQVKVNRWEFPKLPRKGEFSARALLDQVLVSAGAGGQLDANEPLAEFEASRSGESCHTSAYLMRVTTVTDDWPERPARRRLWCLAEEARMRLRRKPLRRLIDIALQTVNDAARPAAAQAESIAAH